MRCSGGERTRRSIRAPAKVYVWMCVCVSIYMYMLYECNGERTRRKYSCFFKGFMYRNACVVYVYICTYIYCTSVVVGEQDGSIEAYAKVYVWMCV